MEQYNKFKKIDTDVLWEGSTGTSTTTLFLSQPMINYKFLIITVQFGVYATRIIPVINGISIYISESNFNYTYVLTIGLNINTDINNISTSSCAVKGWDSNLLGVIKIEGIK